MKSCRNWIINDVARATTKGEHTYVRTGQTLYPLHNFVVRGDNNQLYVGSIIETYARPTGVQLKKEAKILTVTGFYH